MTGNTDKQERFWTQKDAKSWHPKAKPAASSRDRKATTSSEVRVKPLAKNKRSSW